MNNDPWGDAAFENEVRETAYFLWEQAGRPKGSENDYWFQALERCLRKRDADRALRVDPPSRTP